MTGLGREDLNRRGRRTRVVSMSDSSEKPTPRLDTADRLERVIDAQSSTLDRIDDKSGRIARLLGILLGVVLSSVSLGIQFDGLELEVLAVPIRLAFTVGTGFLLSSLAAAIVTLLSSRLRIGLTPVSGEVLSDPNYETDICTHLSRVVGTYAYSIRQNRAVIETNVRRLRRTLVLFLVGELYVGLSVALFVSRVTGRDAWVSFGLLSLTALVLARYVLSGSYLTLEARNITNE